MTFDEWFNEQEEWWHKETAKRMLSEAWSIMDFHKIPATDCVKILDLACYAIRNEYGD